MHWQLQQTLGYSQLLQDYAYWNSRDFYREKMQKFVSGELSASKFVEEVLGQILTDWEEARELADDFRKQAAIDLDHQSFGFSSIFQSLLLPLEAFDDGPSEGEEESFYFTEENLRKGIKEALIEIEKYFKNYYY